MALARRKAREIFSLPEAKGTKPSAERYVLAAAFAVSFSGVAYELLLATYATYLWGGSVFQYSLVFSSMMLAMGLGSWISDRGQANPIRLFLVIEGALALLGIVCLPLLYTIYAKGFAPVAFIFGFSISFGVLVGLEIPLLNRWLGREKNVAELLAVDFAGGFLGGILFPIFLVPYLGLFRVAGVVALLNTAVALYGTRFLERGGKIRLATALLFAGAVLFIFSAAPLQHFLEFRYFGF